LHGARLFRLFLPQSVGGDEVDPATYFHAVAELASHDASIAWNVFVGNSAALIAAFLTEQSAREIFSDPRALVAWGPPGRHRAKAVPGGYEVHGRWDFASGCRQATWMGAHCQVVEADGELRRNQYGTPIIRTLLFPAERAELIDDWHVIGLCGTASDSYRVEPLFVPEAFSSTREEPASRREQGQLYAFTMFGLYSVGVAAVAYGSSRQMLADFVQLAQTKKPRGLGRLADSNSVQGEVARAHAKLEASATWLTQVLRRLYDSVSPGEVIDLKARAEVRLGSIQTIQCAVEVSEFCYRRAGVSAIFKSSPFERRFRDIHTLSQQIQSRESHFESVGDILLGGQPTVFY